MGNSGVGALLMISIGQLIQAKLNEKGRTVVWLSRQIPCSRQNLYKVFKKDCIDTEMLMRISQILEYDFFQYYSSDFKSKADCHQ